MLHLDTRDARNVQDHTPTTDEHEFDALTRLRPLLAAAAGLDVEDREGWTRLRHAARITTGTLAVGGTLPMHLTVGPDDSPALVARIVAAAWRHATSAPSREVVER